METKQFFKRCPHCLFISGFDLDNKSILRGEKYLCSYCSKEHKLTTWKPVKPEEYNPEVKAINLLLKSKVKLKYLIDDGN